MISEITLGATQNAEMRDRLVRILKLQEDLTGHLVTGWPLYSTGGRTQAVNVMLISSTGQITLLDSVLGTDPGEYRDRQDDACNRVMSDLQMDRQLMDGRRPRFTIQTVTYAPLSGQEDRTDPERPLVSSPQALLDVMLKAQLGMPGTADPSLVFTRIGPG